MPKGPKGEERPADWAQRAHKVFQIAVGEIEDRPPTPEEEGKDAAAVALGQRGGAARAAKLSKKQRAEIARNAARARWKS